MSKEKDNTQVTPPPKAHQLKTNREAVLLNRTEAAKRLGVDRKTLTKWENGESTPHTSRRSSFIQYLCQSLKMNEGEVCVLWKELMVNVWGWEDVTDEELSKGSVQNDTQSAYQKHGEEDEKEETPYLFRFGSYELPYYILEGDGEVAYSPENITCYYEDKPLELPAEIAQIKAEIAAIETAKGKDDPTYKWNGPQYYLAGWMRSRTAIEEHPVLRLWFGPSDYYTYMATSMSLHTQKVLDPKTATKKTLYEKYFIGSGYDWSSRFLKPYPLFSTVFGLVLALITRDNKMMILQRPKSIGGRAGVLNIAINESAHPIKDKIDHLDDPTAFGAPDLYKTAVRGGKEELNLHTAKITFLAFGVDTEYSMWNMLGYATTHLTAQQVKNTQVFGADKWEGHGIYTVNCNSAYSVIDFVHSRIKRAKAYYATDVWSPGALTAVYLTLVHKFGKREVEAEIDRYFK